MATSGRWRTRGCSLHDCYTIRVMMHFRLSLESLSLPTNSPYHRSASPTEIINNADRILRPAKKNLSTALFLSQDNRLLKKGALNSDILDSKCGMSLQIIPLCSSSGNNNRQTKKFYRGFLRNCCHGTQYRKVWKCHSSKREKSGVEMLNKSVAKEAKEAQRP